MILVDTNILIDFLKNPTKEKESIFKENEIKNNSFDRNSISTYFDLLKMIGVISEYKIKKKNYIKFVKTENLNKKMNICTLMDNKIFKEKMNYDLLLQYIKTIKLSFINFFILSSFLY